MTPIEEIAAERKHQIEDHGYDATHDDAHTEREIAWAAVCYIAPGPVYVLDNRANAVLFKDPWPWAQVFDARPYNGNVIANGDEVSAEDRRRLLIKAAAMLVAEIERLDRAVQSKAA